MTTVMRRLLIVIVLIGSGGCATSLENVVRSPRVELTNVEVMGLGFKNQAFMLSFDVSNPNPFPLPVKDVSYGIRLDGQRFASGTTPSGFSVPAEGDARFAISVELDLLQTAPRLLSIVRRGDRTHISYELEGALAVDIPLTPPIAYKTRGSIRIGGSAY